MMFMVIGLVLILGGVLLWRGLNIEPDAPTGEPEPRDDWDGVHVYEKEHTR